ncbi:hypothetical protein [Paraglaciecola sp.]|uniref:hypothetical protein n=1 Tax=Paraglaciecola sp. TaxID=1920173 RepID=UPI0030F38EFC
MYLETIFIDARTALLLFGCLLLAFTGWVFGIKFLKLGNHILGYEYLIVGSSGLNFLFYNITLYQPSYDLMIYLDAFSRAFGFPILGTLGFLAVTHNYKVPTRAKVTLFVTTLGLSAVMLLSDFVLSILPYFYLVIMYLFCFYLFYVSKKLFDIGRKGLGVFLFTTTLASLLIASIYDFYKIPGEETNVVFNFYFLALVSWSISFIAMYCAYVALNKGLVLKGKQ